MLKPDYSPFIEALTSSGDPLAAACGALWQICEETIGVKLITLMRFDANASVAARFYSNMPGVYPISGTKPINTSYWAHHVLSEKRIFMANTIETIAEVFDDHALIYSLGYASIVNVPIVIGGAVAGTVNCLHKAEFYTPTRLAATETLKLPASACLLLEQNRILQGAA